MITEPKSEFAVSMNPYSNVGVRVRSFPWRGSSVVSAHLFNNLCVELERNAVSSLSEAGPRRASQERLGDRGSMQPVPGLSIGSDRTQGARGC